LSPQVVVPTAAAGATTAGGLAHAEFFGKSIASGVARAKVNQLRKTTAVGAIVNQRLDEAKSALKTRVASILWNSTRSG
jgi:uncharacterized metal-binding protein